MGLPLKYKLIALTLATVLIAAIALFFVLAVVSGWWAVVFLPACMLYVWLLMNLVFTLQEMHDDSGLD